MKRSFTCFLTAVALLAGADLRAENVYSPGGWATLHRGPANRKLVPDVTLADDYHIWTALEGSAVLTAPTMSPDGRTLYVTTGRAAGHSNLHAFDLDGDLLWQSEPWQGASQGVDPCALLSRAIVDDQGDVYIGDCNQLFAFRPDGSVKWVVALPSIREGDWKASESIPINALTTAVFTRDGHVLGVTNAGDVIVVDRATGRSMAEPMRLPGLVPVLSTTVAMPESVFSEGLVDPEIREWAWQLLFGGAMRSANTPGVDLESGRVFVAATSTNEGKGALYALDLIPHGQPGPDGETIEITIAYATVFHRRATPSMSAMRSASSTRSMRSPAISDGRSRRSPRRRQPPSVRMGTSTRSRPTAQRWSRSLRRVRFVGRATCMQALADAALPSSWLLGDPVAIGNGNPTVVGGVVLVPVAYGYETTFGRRIPWLVQSSLVAIDAATGKGLRNVVVLADDSTGITSVLPDGTIINSLGTAITSGLAPLAGIADWVLPEDFHLLRAVGGIQVSRPRIE